MQKFVTSTNLDLQGKSAQLVVRQQSPFNAETALSQLTASFITPTESFYVRNHAATPDVNSETYRLTVDGLAKRPLTFTLAELKNLAKHTVTAALACAGNRRDELMAVKPIPGEVPWGSGAIGNAEWTGVPLECVLDLAGVPEEAQHVAFEGLDRIEKNGKTFGFGGSVPLDKAYYNRYGETILAYEMNGEPLLPAHGFPLRAVVPGYIGARSVKWLSKITLQAEPSDNYYQAHAYKIFPADVTAETVDWTRGLMLGENSLNTIVCRPANGETVGNGWMTIEGIAIASSGRTVERVDVSTNNGATWKTADLSPLLQDFALRNNPFAWRVWRTRFELPVGEHTIVARAWDSAASTQPETAADLWNFKGYMNNAWHRIQVAAL